MPALHRPPYTGDAARGLPMLNTIVWTPTWGKEFKGTIDDFGHHSLRYTYSLLTEMEPITFYLCVGDERGLKYVSHGQGAWEYPEELARVPDFCA